MKLLYFVFKLFYKLNFFFCGSIEEYLFRLNIFLLYSYIGII